MSKTNTASKENAFTAYAARKNNVGGKNGTTLHSMGNASQATANSYADSDSYANSDKQKNFSPARLASIRVAYTAKAFRVERKLAIQKLQRTASVTCLKTGVTSTIDLPYIPGFTLVAEHPLSILYNARGLAQRGRSYLAQLDSVVLAGIFITLATEYELLSTGSQWLAHEANATLRTAGKPALIEAILLVETWIHSKNYIYLPRLSLLTQNDDTQFTVAARVVNWLKLLHDAITRPDTVSYDANAKPEKVVFQSVQKISVVNRQAAKALTLARREFATDKKILKELAPTLKSASAKLRNYLLTLSTGTLLLTADSGVLILLRSRVADCTETEAAAKIVSILEKEYELLRKELGSDDPFSDDDTDSNEANEPLLTSMLDASQNTNSGADSVGSELVSDSLDSNEVAESSEATEPEPEPDYKNMSPVQKILARKAWLRRTGRSEARPFKTVEEEEASHFSLAPNTILGTAPVYKPTAEKDKLAGYIAGLTGEDDATF